MINAAENVYIYYMHMQMKSFELPNI